MKINIKSFAISLFIAIVCITPAFTQNPVSVPKTTMQVAQNSNYVNPLDVVAKPNKFLNQTVTIRGKFDKFSTLGLDYAPAMRSSENYITFLIQRNDVANYNIPLSEMKIFLKRTEAEKHIDLDAGDEIEFSGKVFSTALGDVWIDAEKFLVVNKKTTEKK